MLGIWPSPAYAFVIVALVAHKTVIKASSCLYDPIVPRDVRRSGVSSSVRSEAFQQPRSRAHIVFECATMLSCSSVSSRLHSLRDLRAPVGRRPVMTSALPAKFELSGKTICITGASRGIGLEV